jgi:hypothetical protein
MDPTKFQNTSSGEWGGNMDNTAQHSKEMAQIHERVTELLREISELLDELATDQESELAATVAIPETRMGDRIAALDCQLRQQFQAEETGHWLDDEVLNSPQQMDALRRVQNEHPSLLRQLADVRESANAPDGTNLSAAELRWVFRRFLARFADHELREGERLYRVLSDEIGVLD